MPAVFLLMCSAASAQQAYPTRPIRLIVPYPPGVASQPYLLVVHPGVPANSVSQLVAYAKAQPGKLSYASAGLGAGAHRPSPKAGSPDTT